VVVSLYSKEGREMEVPMSHKFAAPPIGPFAENCVYVDHSSTSDSEDGSLAHPYKTIQAALTAKPAPTSAAEANSPWAVLIIPGYYPEDLVIPTTGTIVLQGSGGQVKLGSATPTTNDITYAAAVGTYSETSSLELRDFYTMGTITVSNAAETANLLMRDAPVGVEIDGTGIFDPEFGILDVRDSTVAAIDFNGEVTIDRCSVVGTCDFTKSSRLENSTFTGAVTSTGEMGVIRGCTFAALATFAANGPAVYQSNFTSVTVADASCYFFDCLINGTFTGPALSYRVNGVTSSISTVAYAGGATEDLIGGGGGGGATVTEYTATVTGDVSAATVFVLNHAAVAIDSNRYEIFIRYTRAGGAAYSYSLGFYAPGVAIDDLRTDTSATWVSDGAKGHFSVDPGFPVGSFQVGCYVYTGGSACGVTAIDNPADLTVVDAVTLQFSPTSNTVGWVSGVQDAGQNYISMGGSSGTYPADYWYTTKTTFARSLISTSTYDVVPMMQFTDVDTTHSVVKICYSYDGVTWYYHNGTTWVTMDPSLQTDWDTKGCLVDVTAVIYSDLAVQDSLGVDLVPGDFATLPGDGALLAYFAVKTLDSSAGLTLNKNMAEVTFIDEGALMGLYYGESMGSSYGWVVRRPTTTLTIVEYVPTGSTPTMTNPTIVMRVFS